MFFGAYQLSVICFELPTVSEAHAPSPNPQPLAARRPQISGGQLSCGPVHGLGASGMRRKYPTVG